MRTLALHVCLGVSVAAASCGGRAGESPSASAPAAPPAAEASAAAPSRPAPATAAAPPPASPLEMKSPVPSSLAADLHALALDPGNLPPIERLEPKALRGVMKLIARSLGVKCADCHQEGDFAGPTPRKKIAAKMWDEFVAKLTFADGTPLFCDSCHQGRTKQLNRADARALSAWMDQNFVSKLKRKDEKQHECETCHVDMDLHFLNKWAGTSSR